MKITEAMIDPKAVEEGRWISDIPELPGVRFKVRGANNSDWRKMSQRLVNSLPRKKRFPNLDPDEADRINAIVLRDTGLLDWHGIEDADEKPIPYSKQKADEYLTKPEYVRIREGVMWACLQVADGQAEDAEEIAGN